MPKLEDIISEVLIREEGVADLAPDIAEAVRAYFEEKRNYITMVVENNKPETAVKMIRRMEL